MSYQTLSFDDNSNIFPTDTHSLITQFSKLNTTGTNNNKELKDLQQLEDSLNSLLPKDTELDYCLGECAQQDCCTKKCCFKSRKQKKINYIKFQEKQFQKLIDGDTVYHQILESDLSCGLQLPENIKHLIYLPNKTEPILIKNKYIVENEGIRINFTEKQLSSLFPKENIMKSYSNTSYVLLSNIDIKHVNLSDFPKGLEFLITLRVDKPKLKIYASQIAHYFNNDITTTSKNKNKNKNDDDNTLYGTIVYSNKNNEIKSNTNNNPSNFYEKTGIRSCLVSRCIQWWNMKTPELKTHPKDPTKCIVKLESTENPGYADSVLAFWLIKVYFPSKKHEITTQMKEGQPDDYKVDKTVVIDKIKELIVLYNDDDDDDTNVETTTTTTTKVGKGNHITGTLHDLDFDNNNNNDEGESEEGGGDVETIIKNNKEELNYLEFDKEEILNYWNKFQNTLNVMHPFLDYKNGMYAYLEPIDKGKYLQNKSLMNSLNYSIELNLTTSSILQYNGSSKE